MANDPCRGHGCEQNAREATQLGKIFRIYLQIIDADIGHLGHVTKENKIITTN